MIRSKGNSVNEERVRARIKGSSGELRARLKSERVTDVEQVVGRPSRPVLDAVKSFGATAVQPMSA